MVKMWGREGQGPHPRPRLLYTGAVLSLNDNILKSNLSESYFSGLVFNKSLINHVLVKPFLLFANFDTLNCVYEP